MTAYDVELKTLDGSGDVMSEASGKVTLLVNVASKCGLTPQYEQLEALQKDFGGDSFTVLGIPCNQFLEQEPGSADEIATFCSTTYGVTFPLSEKIEVNGDGRHALYEQLVDVADEEGHTGDIRWNFEKFLIGADGKVIERFDPTTVPDDPKVIEAIRSAIG